MWRRLAVFATLAAVRAVNLTVTSPDGVRWHSAVPALWPGRPFAGLLVDVPRACSAHLPAAPRVPWVALADRLHCPDAKKLVGFAESNASAVILYGDGPRTPLRVAGLGLPAVYIDQVAGEALLGLLRAQRRVEVRGTPTETLAVPNLPPLGRAPVMVVTIAFIVLMAFTFLWLLFYYVQKFRYLQAKDCMAKQLGTAARKALEKIPTRTLPQTDVKLEMEECCAVCIEAFSSGERVRELPCGHTFHQACVDPWLLANYCCPMCKLDILGYYQLRSQPRLPRLVLNLDFETY